MKILADTNVFVKFCHRQPLSEEVEHALNDASVTRCLSPVSVIEIFRLWREGRLTDNPDDWINFALPSWTILPVTVPIARQSALWDWQHRDPADRLLAATTIVERVELWHTDTIIKKLTGFPHRYFTNKTE